MHSIEETIQLVKNKITWNRKWSDTIPNYIHSLRVYESLNKYWFSEDIQTAWLLHDIVEDGWVSFEELKSLWYDNNILDLINLSTHDILMLDKFERWKKMIERLIKENKVGARAIKLADISDNLLECHLMPNKEKLDQFLNKKCPVFVYYGNKYFWWTNFYNEFLERYFNQIKAYNQYFVN